MVWHDDEVACPFCGSTLLNASYAVSDMPPTRPDEMDQDLDIYCSNCFKSLFSVTLTFDKQLLVSGVSFCGKCQKELYNSSNKNWDKKYSSMTIYPTDAREKNCKRCGGELHMQWWHYPPKPEENKEDDFVLDFVEPLDE